MSPSSRPSVWTRRSGHRGCARVASSCEIEAFCERRGGEDGLLVRFAAHTGLRAGETAALQVGDVNLQRRRIHVRRSVTEMHGKLEYGSPSPTRPARGAAFLLARPRHGVGEQPPFRPGALPTDGRPLNVTEQKRHPPDWSVSHPDRIGHHSISPLRSSLPQSPTPAWYCWEWLGSRRALERSITLAVEALTVSLGRPFAATSADHPRGAVRGQVR